MSSDNRTNEFLSLARNIRISDPSLSLSKPTNGDNNNNINQQHDKKKNFQELRTFHQQAATISKDIASTSALLTQLTDKVKHKSLLFQDQDAVSVNQLVVRIKQSIENLNARLDTAQKTIQYQKKLFGKNSQAAEASANVVVGLQNEFALAANNFKTILEQRTESLKESDNFKKQVYGRNNSSSNNANNDDMDDIPDMTSHLQAPPPVYGNSSSTSCTNNNTLHHAYSTGALFPTLDLTSALTNNNNFDSSTSSSLPRPHGIAGSTTAGSGISSSTSSRPYSAPNTGGYSGSYSQPSSSLLSPFEIQKLEEESGSSQLMQLLPTQQSDYLQTRAEAMSAVETNIVELGTIFNKLAGLVNEHREMVQRVEDNVDEANTNVLMSMNVLTDTLQSLQSGKMLGLKLFSILVTFIVIFIIFFA